MHMYNVKIAIFTEMHEIFSIHDADFFKIRLVSVSNVKCEIPLVATVTALWITACNFLPVSYIIYTSISF